MTTKTQIPHPKCALRGVLTKYHLKQHILKTNIVKRERHVHPIYVTSVTKATLKLSFPRLHLHPEITVLKNRNTFYKFWHIAS